MAFGAPRLRRQNVDRKGTLRRAAGRFYFSWCGPAGRRILRGLGNVDQIAAEVEDGELTGRAGSRADLKRQGDV